MLNGLSYGPSATARQSQTLLDDDSQRRAGCLSSPQVSGRLPAPPPRRPEGRGNRRRCSGSMVTLLERRRAAKHTDWIPLAQCVHRYASRGMGWQAAQAMDTTTRAERAWANLLVFSVVGESIGYAVPGRWVDFLPRHRSGRTSQPAGGPTTILSG
jgi:hypothetical protein